MTRRTALAIAAALLGIVASAAVAWLASQVAGQRIGLSSEPPSVAAGLVPRSGPDTAQPVVRHRRRPVPVRTTTAAPPHTPGAPAAPSKLPTLPSAPSASTASAAQPRAPSGQHEDSGGGSGSNRDD